MKRLFTLTVLCLIGACSWAQTGTLTGKVSDAGAGGNK